MGDDHGWEETGYRRHPHSKHRCSTTWRRRDCDWIASAAIRVVSPTRGSFLTVDIRIATERSRRVGRFVPKRSRSLTSQKSRLSLWSFRKWHVERSKPVSPTNPGAMGFDEWLSHDNFFELNPWLSRNGIAGAHGRREPAASMKSASFHRSRSSTQRAGSFLSVWFGSPHEPYSGFTRRLGAVRRPAGTVCR